MTDYNIALSRSSTDTDYKRSSSCVPKKMYCIFLEYNLQLPSIPRENRVCDLHNIANYMWTKTKIRRCFDGKISWQKRASKIERNDDENTQDTQKHSIQLLKHL